MGEAYGLYSHIRANRTRSVVLIGGLFLLVYILVFAFVLAFNGFVIGEEPLDVILDETWRQFMWLLPALDQRLEVFLQGTVPPESQLHKVYIACDVWTLILLARLAWMLAPAVKDDV